MRYIVTTFSARTALQIRMDSDNYLHRQIVNEIANRAFLTAASNRSLSDREPADYLHQIEEKYPGALASQYTR